MTLRNSTRTIALGLLTWMAASLGGCASSPSPAPSMSAVNVIPAEQLEQSAYNQPAESEYVIRPADILSVAVFREDQLSSPGVVVAADGNISLPLIGRVAVAGETTSSVELLVEQALKARYLQNPEVAVNVVKYGSHVVTVEGAVKSPGLYTFSPGTRLSGGISLAQGPERTAKTNNIAVFRESPQGVQVAKFDYEAVQAGTMLDPVLQPGDRIVVGTNGLSVFWQDVLRSIPFFGLFSRY